MRLSDNPIDPIGKERVVSLDPQAAFQLFTDGIASWWPLSTHSIGQEQATDLRFEGGIGGRIVETTDDGTEHTWAEVIAWDPPHRFVVAWHPAIDPEAASILELRFEATVEGTRVILEHSRWEEFGAEAGLELRDGYDGGWEGVLQRLEEVAAEPHP